MPSARVSNSFLSESWTFLSDPQAQLLARSCSQLRVLLEALIVLMVIIFNL